MVSRSPCTGERLARRIWWSGTVTLRLLRIASAACCYWHYSPKNGRACRSRTGLGQFCKLPDRSQRAKNKTAAQVTRREKTSLPSVLNDRGLKIGGAGGTCTHTGRSKSPLCYIDTTAPEKWCARRESHPGLRTGRPPRCCYATRALETRPLPDSGRRLASYGSDRAKRAPASDREPALP